MQLHAAPRHATSAGVGEFRRGWHIVLLGLMGLATSASVTVMYAFGAMVLPLQATFGWSRGDIQTAMTFYAIGSVVTMQLAGWLTTCFGLRRISLASLVALAAFYLLLTRIDSLAMLYAGCALITLAGVGTLHVTWTQLVALWFVKRRGTALAITLTGSGIAATFLPAIVTWAIQHWGWQAGFVVLAIPPLLLTLPLALCWLRDNGPQDSHGPASAGRPSGVTFSVGVRSPTFWYLALALVLVILGIWPMLMNIVPMLQDKGLSATTASHIFGAYGVALIVGRLLVGILMDRWWAPGIACLTLVLPALGCLLFLFAEPSIIAMSAATMLIGIGVGAEIDIAAFLVARYFGLRDYPRLFGLLMALLAGGGCLAPYAFGALYDYTGSYQPMLWICTVVFTLGPLALLPMGRYPDLPPAESQTAAGSDALAKAGLRFD